jgi:hypothetical protein
MGFYMVAGLESMCAKLEQVYCTLSICGYTIVSMTSCRRKQQSRSNLIARLCPKFEQARPPPKVFPRFCRHVYVSRTNTARLGYALYSLTLIASS